MKKKDIIKFLGIAIFALSPVQTLAAQVENVGTYNIPATANATDSLIEYDHASTNEGTIIVNIGNKNETYSYTKDNGGFGIVSIGSYNNGILNTTINGNINFTRTNTTTNDVKALDVYSNTNLTLNGSFVTEQNANITQNRVSFIYGISVAAKSSLNITKDVTINGIKVTSSVGDRTQAIAILSSSNDGASGSSSGTSKVTLGTNNDNKCLITNVESTNNNHTSNAIAVMANGETQNTPVESTLDINSALTIDNVKATGPTSESYGVLGAIKGIVTINNDLSIDKITSTTNNSYSIAATWGGKVILSNNDATRTIKGDIYSLNCLNDSNDRSIVELNLTNDKSSLTGATITDDSSDNIFGIINMNLTNNSIWHLTNRTRTETIEKQGLSEVTNLTNNSNIDMYNNEHTNQTLNITNLNKSTGSININTDLKNVSGTNKTDYINIENANEASTITINATDKNMEELANYKQLIATTPNNVTLIPGEITISSGTYYPIIESSNNGNGKLDWYITGYTKKAQITVSFNTDGGSTIPPVTGNKGDIIELTETPTKDGYKFLGWYTDEELTNKVTEITLDENVTLYAKWEKIDSTTPTPPNPSTADIIITWVITAGISLAVIIILVLALIKNKKKEEPKEINKTNKTTKK